MPISFLAETNEKIKEAGVGSKVYDVAGSYTFTVPTGVDEIYVGVWGAGGSGGFNSSYGATGGGGGGFAGGWIKPASSTYSVVVGSGGRYALNSGDNGYDGGSSSFGTIFSATGGKAGVSSTANENRLGGAGGVGSISGDVFAQQTTASGGRGGNVNFLGGTHQALWSGGGASGSPLGDGGRGGDIYSFRSGGNSYTGGGGWANGHGGDLVVGQSSGDIRTGGGGAFHRAGTFRNNTGSNARGGSPFGGGGWNTNANTTYYDSGHRGAVHIPTYYNLIHGRLFNSYFNQNDLMSAPIGVGGSPHQQFGAQGGMCAGNAGYATQFVSNLWFVALGGGNGFKTMNTTYDASVLETFSAGNASGGGGCTTSYAAGGGAGIVIICW